MYQQNTNTTTHQINTLLLHLNNRTEPPEGMLFFQPLVNANLDGTPDSIERLSRLLTQLQGYLTQKNTSLETLVSQPQSRLFFLTIAGYLGDYLAKSCDEFLIWYSYFEARTEIDKKNRAYGTDFQLEQAFENSVVAKIGDNMYCQPLRAVQQHLAGQGDISEFVAQMQADIFEQTQVNIMAEPNQVCRAYLQKVKTGRLLDNTLGFFEQLKTVNFDYSVSSLAELDKTFAQIKQQYVLTPDTYQSLISEPAHQATLYLLGFYIGMTCAKVTEKPVTWANYQQIYRTLIYANPNAKLVDSIEHSFVMVVETQTNNATEKRFVTPILVVTQSLFGISDTEIKNSENPSAPLTATAFYQAFEQNFADNNHSNFQTFPYPTPTTATQIPKLWQIALQSASRLVNNNLMQIFDGSELEPQVFELDPVTKKGNIQPLASLTQKAGKITAREYLRKNPKQSLVLITTQDTLINLPSGQCDGVAVDIAVYHEPKLRLRVTLPYRPAESGAGFAIYPLIVANVALQNVANEQKDDTLQSLMAEFYQSATAFDSPMHEGNFWQNYYLEPVNSPKKSPLQQQIDHQQADKITLTLLPVAPLAPVEVEPVIEPVAEPMLQPIAVPQSLPQAVQPVLPEISPMQTSQAIPTPVATPVPTLTVNANVNQFYNQNSAPLPKPQALKTPNPTPTLETTNALPKNETPKAQISPELLAQLRQDQERLQSQLSTSDGDKDRKMMMMGGAVVMILIILLLGAWLMK